MLSFANVQSVKGCHPVDEPINEMKASCAAITGKL